MKTLTEFLQVKHTNTIECPVYSYIYKGCNLGCYVLVDDITIFNKLIQQDHYEIDEVTLNIITKTIVNNKDKIFIRPSYIHGDNITTVSYNKYNETDNIHVIEFVKTIDVDDFTLDFWRKNNWVGK